MNIIGISAHYHDSACCLIKNGKLVSAVEEERLSRIKHDNRIPINSFLFCLEENNIGIGDIDCIAYYEQPEKKISRQLWSTMVSKDQNRLLNFLKINVNQAENDIREVLGYQGKILFFDHHLSHAASSFHYSGFVESAILTVDGVGEWDTATFGYGDQNGIKIFKSNDFPDSIGLLYSTLTSFLGFKVNDGEYKVMGLAPYGKPTYLARLRKLIHISGECSFELNHKYFNFNNTQHMYTDHLADLLKCEPRMPESQIYQLHFDIAKSLQCLLEEILLKFANYLYKIAPSDNLSMAGGVALNCVANTRILKDGPFKNLFVQPAAGDSGAALGAAVLAYKQLTGKSFSTKLSHVYLGPSYSHAAISNILLSTPIKYKTDNKEAMLTLAIERLNAGKVLGWFQGRLEFGPRALGSRSILADPRGNNTRDRINASVKKRESFRPFAPSVLYDEAMNHFDIDHASPFMLETCQVISKLKLPAITHVDNSARIQTVSKEDNQLYYELISRFCTKTGCPILLNTSFNLRSEPIVADPIDAIICFLRSEIDTLVLGNYLIDREDIPDAWYEWYQKSTVKKGDVANHDVYTFI